MKNICVLLSGGGTNFQALINAEKNGIIKSGKITLAVTDNPNAYGIIRAKNAGIKIQIIDIKKYLSREDFDLELCRVMKENSIDVIVFAGFNRILGERFTSEFENKMINVHPSLIPSFCGDGFYGLKVHEAVLEKGVKVTGATVHFVNNITDGGAIILQKAVSVMQDDTKEVLQKRVMEEAEWIILPMATELLCSGRVKIIDNKAIIV